MNILKTPRPHWHLAVLGIAALHTGQSGVAAPPARSDSGEAARVHRVQDVSHADDYEKQIGWWQVYRYGAGCWISAEFQDGLDFRYSLELSPIKSFLILSNDKWKSVRPNRSYRIRLEVDDWQTSLTATASLNAKGVSFFLSDPAASEFPLMLARGRSFRAFVDGKPIGSYDLKDSGQAVKELARCAAQLKPAAKEDPFQDI